MKIVNMIKLLLGAVTYFLKEAAKTASDAALRVALDEERKAQERIIRAILKYETPNDYQRAYIESLRRELQVYERIRSAALRRFESSTEEGTSGDVH